MQVQALHRLQAATFSLRWPSSAQGQHAVVSAFPRAGNFNGTVYFRCGRQQTTSTPNMRRHMSSFLDSHGGNLRENIKASTTHGLHTNQPVPDLRFSVLLRLLSICRRRRGGSNRSDQDPPSKSLQYSDCTVGFKSMVDLGGRTLFSSLIASRRPCLNKVAPEATWFPANRIHRKGAQRVPEV
jgi:hypothetical protein